MYSSTLIYLFRNFLFILLISRFHVKAKNDFELVFETHDCTSSDGDKLLDTLTCNLGKNAKRRGLNMELKLNANVQHFTMDLLIVMPRKMENFTLLNLTDMHGCDVLVNRNTVTLVKLWRSSLDRYGNLPWSCPLRMNTLYFVRGYRFDLDAVPAFSFASAMNVWYKLKFTERSWVDGYVSGNVTLRNGRKYSRDFSTRK